MSGMPPTRDGWMGRALGAGSEGRGGTEDDDEEAAEGARGFVHVTSPVEVFQKYQAGYVNFDP